MAKRLYALEVCIIEGPMTEAFVEANPVVCRTIEIRGEHTLGRLHEAIFEAFDRWERHMYEFQLGSGPHDPEGDRYGIGLPFAMPPDPSDTRTPAGAQRGRPSTRWGSRPGAPSGTGSTSVTTGTTRSTLSRSGRRSRG